MKNEVSYCQVLENKHLVSDFYLLTLKYQGNKPEPGQFANLTVEPYFLKRPFAVFDYEPGFLKLLYKKVGDGTARMTQWEPGGNASILSPLGNGFPPAENSRNRVLLGGGTGIASLYYYAKTYPEQTQLLIGVNQIEEAKVMKQLFSALKAEVKISVAQGPAEDFFQGSVLDLLVKEKGGDTGYDLYACGPHGMFQALARRIDEKTLKPEKTLLSLEARMGCGFGICLGCAVEKKGQDGFFYVCKDGPVFPLEELDLHG